MLEGSMTIKQFAAKYQVCRNTVGNWRKEGLLETLKVGGTVRITAEQEAAFIIRNAEKAA